MDIKEEIIKLGNTGCQGNVEDFCLWIEFYEGTVVTFGAVTRVLTEMVRDKLWKIHPEIQTEFYSAGAMSFNESVQYYVPGDKDLSPIQLVRSRLESFLKFNKIKNEQIIDLSIATTEAIENAVKYTNDRKIFVEYSISGDNFRVKIINNLTKILPENDIRLGKYTSSITLMRGMMVMEKLFDDLDIDISEENKKAIFTAEKLIQRL